MESDINLKKIEKKVYMSFHGDGIWDIFLGLWFVSTALFIRLDIGYMIAIMVPIMLPPVMKLKKSFTLPRLGYVKFSAERQAREKKNMLQLSILLAMTAIAGVGVFFAFTGRSDWQNWVRSLGIIPFGLVIAVVLTALGLLYDIRRFIGFGALVLAVFIAAHFAHADLMVQFLVPGVVFLIVGLVLLVRFMRKYPRTDGEAPHVGR